jgi:hypothetical protein
MSYNTIIMFKVYLEVVDDGVVVPELAFKDLLEVNAHLLQSLGQ